MSKNFIHPTAIIGKTAYLGEDVKVGPYCVVGDQVKLEDNVELISHVSIEGRTVVGSGTKIYPFSSIGHPPQDLKFKGEDSVLIIGKNNVIREYVTLQPGTMTGLMKTVLGDNCLLMAGAHIAHDCVVGNNVVLANNATLAGHVTVEDSVIIGGLSAIHQFVRLGTHSIIGGMSGVEYDVIPYGSVKGERASLYGLNLVGLKRKGMAREEIDLLRNAYKMLFSHQKTLAERVQEVENIFNHNVYISKIINFIKEKSTRALCVPKNHESF